MDDVFYSVIKQRKINRIRNFYDVFQIRTNFMYMRSCPAAMFWYEGFCKLISFCIVSYVASNLYTNKQQIHIDYTLIISLLMTISTMNVIHEIGELQETGWDIQEYLFKVSLNYITNIHTLSPPHTHTLLSSQYLF